MQEYIKIIRDSKAGSVSVCFYVDKPEIKAIGEKMKAINEQADMNGHNWEAFLNYYLENHHADVAGGMGSDPKAKVYEAFYKLNPNNEKKAEKLAEIIEGLVANESEIYEIVKNNSDEIDWD